MPRPSSIALCGLIAVSSLLGGCATTPPHLAELSADVVNGRAGRVGVVMTALPKVDTAFPGAYCLLCLAAASAANSTLTRYTHTLSTDEVVAYRADVVKTLKSRGADAVEITDVLDVKKLPDVKSPVPDAPKKDFKGLRSTYNVDELFVVEVDALGIERNYSAYIPNGVPAGFVFGKVYIVDLATNTYRWQLDLKVEKQPDGAWDEPPSFPGLTNAYFSAIELGRDQILIPLKQ